MIKRKVKEKIVNTLSLKEITIVTGPRQVGKTTILKEIIGDIKKKGRPTAYFNLDIEEDGAHFESQQKLINKIRLEVGNEKAYVFIDEIQRKENAGRFLKGIYDMDLPYKFIVSGSGSLELKEQVSEALTGRKLLIEMNPVSFLEFVNYKTQYKYHDRLGSFFQAEEEKTVLLLEEYLAFGGYPAVVTAETIQRKMEVMNEIFVSYITKDITFLLGIRHPDKFVKLIRLLAVLSGNIISYSQLTQDAGIRLETLKAYLWYAEQTFIIKTIKPYFTNPKKELVKSPVIYFNDLGMLNFSKNNFMGAQPDGMLFQNFIFLILKEKFTRGLARIHFWRTKEKAEVDFILQGKNGVIPVEVKFKDLKKVQISRSFRSFLKKYKPQTGIIVSLNFSEIITIEETAVRFIPFWQLITEESVEISETN